MEPDKLKPESVAAQALGWTDAETHAILPPLHLATTFIRDPDNQYRSGHAYGRDHNPTYKQAEALLTALEGGFESLLFASGMAAATAVFLALTPGDRVLAPKVMYWALRDWLGDLARAWGLDVEFVDMSSLDAVAQNLRRRPVKLAWIETPANPLWGITDIAQVCHLVHRDGGMVAVDSTVATPVLCQPLALGADFVMHAATKYLNGHSDVIAGAVTAAADGPLWQRIRHVRSHGGAILGPFEAWLLTRGMRTLFPRVRHACASAQRIAEHFAADPRIVAVLYPGLPSFPGHALAAKQMTGGFGGMLSLRFGGDGTPGSGERTAIRTASRVRLWKRATSLGGVESLIEHRASLEGPGTPVPTDLLRLSVGLEAADDLIADLEQALAAP